MSSNEKAPPPPSHVFFAPAPPIPSHSHSPFVLSSAGSPIAGLAKAPASPSSRSDVDLLDSALSELSVSPKRPTRGKPQKSPSSTPAAALASPVAAPTFSSFSFETYVPVSPPPLSGSIFSAAAPSAIVFPPTPASDISGLPASAPVAKIIPLAQSSPGTPPNAGATLSAPSCATPASCEAPTSAPAASSQLQSDVPPSAYADEATQLEVQDRRGKKLAARRAPSALQAPLVKAPPEFLAPPSLWESLPIDLFALIFSFLHNRPRLLLIARVCKRWKIAALKSIPRMRPKDLASLHTCVRLLPCISKLKIDFYVSSLVALPTSLRTLHLTVLSLPPNRAEDEAPQRLLLPTSLTHLALQVGPDAKQYAPLLSNLQPFLATLKLSLSSLDPIDGLIFPSLSRLSLRCDPTYRNFLLAHANQLTSLTLLGQNANSVVANPSADTLSFPKLRHLEIELEAPSEEDGRALLTLVSNCPQLRSVTLHLSWAHIAALVPLVSRFLTCVITTYSGEPVNDVAAVLAACPRLSSVRILQVAEVELRLLTAKNVPLLLHSLKITNVRVVRELALYTAPCANLTHLDIGGELEAAVAANWTILHNLTTLILRPALWFTGIMSNRHSPLYAPRLRSLTVHLVSWLLPDATEHEDNMLNYLRDAEKRGLERAEITVHRPMLALSMFANDKSSFKWLALVVTHKP